MTPDQLKEARRKLGLSTAGLARVLRLGAGGARTVRRWESGESGIPGPAQVAIEFMLEPPGDRLVGVERPDVEAGAAEGS